MPPLRPNRIKGNNSTGNWMIGEGNSSNLGEESLRCGERHYLAVAYISNEYQDDFTVNAGSLQEFVNLSFRSTTSGAFPAFESEVAYTTYDWSLNE